MINYGFPIGEAIDALVKLAQMPSMVKHRIEIGKDIKRIEFLNGKLSKLNHDFEEALKEPNSEQIELEQQYELMETHIRSMIQSIKDKYPIESEKNGPKHNLNDNNAILQGDKK